MHPSILSASLAMLFLIPVSSAQTLPDFVVPAGQTVVYDTANGPILAKNILIGAGSTLHVVGMQPLRMRAIRLARIEGTIDLSGSSSIGVNTYSVADIPHPGADGAAGGGSGGTGNPIFTTYCAAGGDALTAQGLPARGGRGGETAYSSFPNSSGRRAGGGGGGALGPDQPVAPSPDALVNVGRIARPGKNGTPQALGAISHSPPPLGGSQGATPFVDGNPNNDFFGRELDTATQTIVVGELAQPLAGRGGGAGGNSTFGSTFPPPAPFAYYAEQVGAGGGGGGGLGIIQGFKVELLGAGKIRCNGGHGGGGENTTNFDRIGGGSGGGSGGMVIVQGRIVDLSHAGASCITALGGRGGQGAENEFDAVAAGGNGGPGIIQIHVALGGAGLHLPAGMTLDQLTAPTAHVLLPVPSL